MFSEIVLMFKGIALIFTGGALMFKGSALMFTGIALMFIGGALIFTGWALIILGMVYPLSILIEKQSVSAVSNPKGADTGSSRVFRGGSWFYNSILCRVALRTFDSPTILKILQINII